MCHVAVVLVCEHRVVGGAADDPVQHEVEAAALIGMTDDLNECTLGHEVDAHRDLHPLIGDGLFRNVEDKSVLRRIENDIVARILINRRM